MIEIVSSQPAGTARRPSDDERAGLAIVRRSDVRALRAGGWGAGGWAPATPDAHGDEDDPRYPSPRVLRETIGFTIDVILHVGGAGAIFQIALQIPHPPKVADLAVLWAVLAFLGLSIGDRIVLQRITGTTVGKALVGLCTIRRDDGGPPTLRQLIRQWLWGWLYVIDSLLT